LHKKGVLQYAARLSLSKILFDKLPAFFKLKYKFEKPFL